MSDDVKTIPNWIDNPWFRTGMVIAGAFCAVGGVVITGSGSEVDPQIQANTRANARQDSALAYLVPRVVYLSCVDFSDRGLTRKTTQECFEDFTSNIQP